jgi:hypothetical protein
MCINEDLVFMMERVALKSHLIGNFFGNKDQIQTSESIPQ